jgi:hypothetical protein
MTDTNYDWEKELDDWTNTYEPMPNLFAPMQAGVYVEDKFETYGEELDHVLKIANSEPNRVWTLVDGDDGNMYIINGYHLVNRINYFITAYPFEGEFLEVPYCIFEESEEEESENV